MKGEYEHPTLTVVGSIARQTLATWEKGPGVGDLQMFGTDGGCLSGEDQVLFTNCVDAS